MTTQQKQSCMFVGIDVHKDTHTAVGVSPFGEKMFEITVGNYKNDFENLVQKVEEKSGALSPFFGLEDVRGYGERLSGYLYEICISAHHSFLKDCEVCRAFTRTSALAEAETVRKL